MNTRLSLESYTNSVFLFHLGQLALFNDGLISWVRANIVG